MENSEIYVFLVKHQDVIGVLGVLVAIIATVCGALAWYTSRKSGSKLSIDAAIKIANDLYENRVKSFQNEIAEKDAQIKSLTEAVQALPVEEALNLKAQGVTEKAEEIFKQIAEKEERKGKEAYTNAAEALRHLGSLAFLHDTQKAFSAYQRSTELDPDNLDGWNQLGHLYKRIGELENAENAYMTVQKLARSDRAWEAVAYGNLGLVYRTRGDLDRAIEYHEKSLAIEKALGRKEGMARTYRNLGLVYYTRGDLDRAIEYHEKALAINEDLGRREGMAIQYGNLGLVYETRGDLDRAIELWKKSLALFTEMGARPQMEQVQSWLDEVQATDVE